MTRQKFRQKLGERKTDRLATQKDLPYSLIFKKVYNSQQFNTMTLLWTAVVRKGTVTFLRQK